MMCLQLTYKQLQFPTVTYSDATLKVRGGSQQCPTCGSFLYYGYETDEFGVIELLVVCLNCGYEPVAA